MVHAHGMLGLLRAQITVSPTHMGNLVKPMKFGDKGKSVKSETQLTKSGIVIIIIIIIIALVLTKSVI